MKKIFALILMTIVVCSCNNAPTIKQIKMSTHDGENLLGEIVPTKQIGLFIYEYDDKERFVFSQSYLTSNEFDDHIREDGLYNENRIIYEKNDIKSISIKSWHKSWRSDGINECEQILYKEDSGWYYIDFDSDIDDSRDEDVMFIGNNVLYPMLDMLAECEGVGFLPIRCDDTFTIKIDDEQIVGRVVEKDKYGNWTKAIAKNMGEKDNEYAVYIREISYYGENNIFDSTIQYIKGLLKK